MRNGIGRTALRLSGLLAVLLLCALAWKTGVVQELTWPSLVAHHAQWQAGVARHPWEAPLAFVVIYAAAVALSLPVGLWLSLLGGLLFGMFLGALLTIIGASLGAMALFLLAKGLLAPLLEARLRRRIGGLRDGLERDGFFYLLALRLMPVFPFWLVNLAPALLGMRFGPYAAATVLGMVPTSFVLSAIGAGLSNTLAAGHRPNATMLLQPQIILPLLALAVMALMPTLWRRWRAKAKLRAAGV